MSEFVNYKMNDFDQHNVTKSNHSENIKAANSNGESESVQEYDLQKILEENPEHAIVKKGAQNHTSRFFVHPLVSSHLELDKEEKVKQEARIKKEIDYRWEILKSKAEVEGYKAGLEQGRREAFASTKPEIETDLLRFSDLLNEISGMRETIFKANEKFLMNIFSLVVERITLKELDTDQDYVKRLMYSLLAKLDSPEEIVVIIAEQDSQMIDLLKESVSQEFPKLKNLVVRTSTDLEPGSCRIETSEGVLSASITDQIKNAMTVFAGTG